MSDAMKKHSKMQDVPLSKMRVSVNAQRELRPSHVNRIVAEFDIDRFEPPVVNYRDGHYWVVDGQHRIEAVKQWLGDSWAKQSITCELFSGLSEKEEADLFDHRNFKLTVSAYDKFRVRVTAGRQDETAVKKAVEAAGLRLSRDKSDGAVSSVSTLLKVFRRSDAQTLIRTLRVVHRSFGEPGLSNHVIDGTARMLERYNGAIKDDDLVDRLQQMRGGVGALVARANVLRNQTRQSLPICFAAAIVDVVNGRRGGKRIPAWWTE